MMKLALGALLFGLVACGGDDGGKPILLDGMPDGMTAECNPVAQTGCAANQKCTWIIDQAVPTQVGHIGCALVDGVDSNGDGSADPDKPIGDACVNAGDPGGNPPGANGFDNCAKGSVCVRGLCEGICDPAALAGAAGSCDGDHTCGRYIGVFEVGGSNVAGACDANCSILDQKRFDGAAACGSPDPAAPIRGCYPNAFFKNGSCAPVRADNFVPTDPMDQQMIDGVKHLDRTDQVLPRFQNCKNCCAPGFVAEYIENDTSMTFTCVGLCAPTPLNTTTVAAKASREFGDDTIVAKLPRSATANAGDGQCTLNHKGTTFGPNTGQNENCVYAWGLFLQQDGTINPMLGPEGEQIGFCFPHAFYHYDSNNDGTDDTAYPNFKSLPLQDPTGTATPGTFPVNPDDACDFVVSGFRATTCTQAQTGFFAHGAQAARPLVPQKQKLRIGGVDAEARNVAY